MPVLSPHRSSSSGLSGSYRSTFSSSSLDRPLYGTSSYSPRFSTYTERYTSRSYADSDGRRIFCRTGSVTEDGITSRFREESRESSVARRDSLSRDSGIGSIRENSVLDARRDSSASRGSAVSLVESVADIRNKYSPANYVPAVLRNKENIARSKTLNDIGLPPIEAAAKLGGKKKVITSEPSNINTSVRELANSTNSAEAEATDNMSSQEDDNGNRPSVSEMRKKFDKGAGGRVARTTTTAAAPSEVPAARLLADNRFKKLDKPGKPVVNGHAKTANAKLTNGDVKRPIDRKGHDSSRKTDGGDSSNVTADRRSKTSKVLDDGAELRGGKQEQRVEDTITRSPAAGVKAEKETTRVNNFASYIPTKDFDKGDVRLEENNGEMDNSTNTGKNKKNTKDLATSPRLNRSPISGLGTTNSSSQRSSLEKDVYTRSSVFDDDDRRYNNRASPGKQLGLNGLKNIGNTCFMNSVIQCLSNTKPLLEYVRKEGYSSDINSTLSSMKGALIKAFAQVLKELWSEDASERVVNTTALKSQIQRFAPRFMGYSQQDAQEFLRYLLEGLHEDVNRVAAKPAPILTEIDEKLSDSDKAGESWQRYLRRENSKVVDIFVGQLKSTLKCTHCGHCSVTFDPFWDLSLPIPQKTGPMRLSQCLESFTREETLDGDEKPTCSKCKERRKCTKSFTIHKFPKILVIHLKRFSPTERFRGKLSVTVDFPLEGLDMSNYAAESHSQCRYNLYAISNHSGTTYSGHYTAYCRHPYSLSWHEYNDSRVSSISSKSIVSGEAYVLFYELDSKLAHL